MLQKGDELFITTIDIIQNSLLRFNEYRFIFYLNWTGVFLAILLNQFFFPTESMFEEEKNLFFSSM
jgi:hypothetical protein